MGALLGVHLGAPRVVGLVAPKVELSAVRWVVVKVAESVAALVPMLADHWALASVAG